MGILATPPRIYEYTIGAHDYCQLWLTLNISTQQDQDRRAALVPVYGYIRNIQAAPAVNKNGYLDTEVVQIYSTVCKLQSYRLTYCTIYLYYYIYVLLS